MAIEAATLANAKKLVLFHHDPSYNDNQLDLIGESAKQQFKEVMVAYEGLEINLV
jgi:phosphoribosyl 1,2-cyclic phosphodiesterase